jgi:DegV family protein with EDD domain
LIVGEKKMIKILSDSTCDLSKELVQRYNIGIIPLYVRLGDEEYLDGVNITPEQIYKWSDEHGETPKTAAASIEDISKFLDPAGSDEYIVFTISSSMSVNFNNVRLAAQELGMSDRVHVIDSANLSTGVGLLVVYAAELAKEGKAAKEIVEEIENTRDKVRASFVIDTLVYLHRGGRCSGLAAFFGTALKIHPRIAVTDGAMHPEKKYRGSSRRYVLDYVKDMEADLENARPERVFITHSGCDREVVEAVREYLSGLGVFKEILETRAGSVVSSHCGPGTLGVLFISK